MSEAVGSIMAGAGVLLTVAEISAIVVGFSAVVFALQPRSATRAAFAARVIVELGLSSMLFALLPLALALLGVAEDRVWQFSCGSLVLFLSVYFTAYFLRRRRPLAEVDSAVLRWQGLYPMVAIGYTLSVVFVLGLLGVGISAGPGLYVLGLTYVLLSAGIQLLLTIMVKGREG